MEESVKCDNYLSTLLCWGSDPRWPTQPGCQCRWEVSSCTCCRQPGVQSRHQSRWAWTGMGGWCSCGDISRWMCPTQSGEAKQKVLVKRALDWKTYLLLSFLKTGVIIVISWLWSAPGGRGWRFGPWARQGSRSNSHIDDSEMQIQS